MMIFFIQELEKFILEKRSFVSFLTHLLHINCLFSVKDFLKVIDSYFKSDEFF